MATLRDTMIRKKVRSPDSTESSSCEKMAPSKPPKDVLGLGRYLVRELGFENGVDTLGRWMAHHLADLMTQSENEPTAAKRLKARKEAVETILKIWDHRMSLPGEAYPLTKYRDVLEGMDRLQPEGELFGYFGRYAGNRREQLAANLFDGFSRLAIALLLMKIAPGKKSKDMDPAAIEALTDTEKRVLMALQEWEKMLKPTPQNIVQGPKSRKGADRPKVNLGEAAIQLVDNLTATLTELRSELQGKSPQHMTIEVKS